MSLNECSVSSCFKCMLVFVSEVNVTDYKNDLQSHNPHDGNHKILSELKLL